MEDYKNGTSKTFTALIIAIVLFLMIIFEFEAMNRRVRWVVLQNIKYKNEVERIKYSTRLLEQ